MTLKEIRDRIAALETRDVHVLDGDGEEPWVRYKAIKLNDALAIIDAALAEPAKPEPGDLVAAVWNGKATGEIGVYAGDGMMRRGEWTETPILLMRAAEVKRKIEEAGK